MKLRAWLSYLLIVAGVALIARWQVPVQRGPASLVETLLNRLEVECDLTSVGNDYQFYPVPPTEARRRQLIEQFSAAGTAALPLVRARMEKTRNLEYQEMLVLAAAALGDEPSLTKASDLLVWSPSPAVRMSAVRLLRQLRDSRTADWLRVALQDERFVLNSDCGAPPERYYPIRAVAEIALLEMGESLQDPMILKREAMWRSLLGK